MQVDIDGDEDMIFFCGTRRAAEAALVLLTVRKGCNQKIRLELYDE